MTTKRQLAKALFGLALIAWVFFGTIWLLTDQADSQTDLPWCGDWTPADGQVCCAEDDPCWYLHDTTPVYPVPTTNDYPVTGHAVVHGLISTTSHTHERQQQP